MMGIKKITVTGRKHKKGDVVKIKIAGVLTNCIVISDYIEKFEMINGDNYLGSGYIGISPGYVIRSWTGGAEVLMYKSYCVLIGDQKVYAHLGEIWE